MNSKDSRLKRCTKEVSSTKKETMEKNLNMRNILHSVSFQKKYIVSSTNINHIKQKITRNFGIDKEKIATKNLEEDYNGTEINCLNVAMNHSDFLNKYD